MRRVKNRLAAVPGQASGNVVSTVEWSAGKRNADGAGEGRAVADKRF